MTKELLTIEFRYYDIPRSEHFSGCQSKTITIGVFDTIEEAVNEGNKRLYVLAKYFEVRANDRFKVKGLFGMPDRLVSNTCYRTKGIQYFAQITSLKFGDLENTINEVFESTNRYREYKRNEQD